LLNFDILSRGALSLLKDKATLESVIESIENGTSEIEATKLEQEPPSEETNEKKEMATDEFQEKKKAMEERIRQRRAEIEGLEFYLFIF